jgi:hypothetical protein
MTVMCQERLSHAARFLHMESSTQYREFAEQCERLARQAKAEHHRDILIEMAEVWRQLAEQADGEV